MPGLCLEASFRRINVDRRILICKMKCLQPLLHPEWSHLSFQDVPERCFVTFSFQRQTRPHQSWSRFSQDYFHVLDPFFYLSKSICKMGKQWDSSPGRILIPESLGPRRQAWGLAALAAGMFCLQREGRGFCIISQ